MPMAWGNFVFGTWLLTHGTGCGEMRSRSSTEVLRGESEVSTSGQLNPGSVSQCLLLLSKCLKAWGLDWPAACNLYLRNGYLKA